MLESLIHFVSSGADVATASQTPHTAIAAVLCAALVGLFS
ncbi:YshB family small membrane protein [Enterobacter sp.]|nr:YshB family small membrane protein [Enterobacter sp.]